MKKIQLILAILITLSLLNCSEIKEDKESKKVSQDILGDWRYTFKNFTYHVRFHPNGLYSYRTSGLFSIANDTLKHLHVKYARNSGNSQTIIGSWREDWPSDSTSFIAYFNSDYSYYFYWTKDGYNGGGYYVLKGNYLSIVETYGYFYCEGDSLYQISLDGIKNAGKYLIQDSVMTVNLPNGPVTYYRESQEEFKASEQVWKHLKRKQVVADL